MSRGNGNLKTRVVITGLGVVSSTGMGKQEFWDAVREGRSGVRHITGFPIDNLYSRIAGQITDFDPTEYMSEGAARRSGKFTHYAVAAAHMAVEDAGIDVGALDPFRGGVVFGTSSGGDGNVGHDNHARWLREGHRSIGATDCVQFAPHAATSHVFIGMGLRGPNATVASGCCAGIEAITRGADFLRSGDADVMVVGGTEACINQYAMEMLCATRVLAHRNEEPEKASRPYDATRDGLVLSEGAGAVVLETADRAVNRGAPIYAEVMGSGVTTEGEDLVRADPSGAHLAQALGQALAEARLAPEEIDYVCAHGIGNVDYDKADTRAIKRVLGDRAYNIPVSSIKSTTGQPFAAGALWQTVAACMAIQTDTVPPTINYHYPEPECDLDYVPNTARRSRVETVMINSHSFGGTHAALIIREFDEAT